MAAGASPTWPPAWEGSIRSGSCSVPKLPSAAGTAPAARVPPPRRTAAPCCRPRRCNPRLRRRRWQPAGRTLPRGAPPPPRSRRRREPPGRPWRWCRRRVAPKGGGRFRSRPARRRGGRAGPGGVPRTPPWAEPPRTRAVRPPARPRREGGGEEGTRLGGRRPAEGGRSAPALLSHRRGGAAGLGRAPSEPARGFPTRGLGAGPRRAAPPCPWPSHCPGHGSSCGFPQVFSVIRSHLGRGRLAHPVPATLQRKISSALRVFRPAVIAASLRCGAYSLSPDRTTPFSCFLTRLRQPGAVPLRQPRSAYGMLQPLLAPSCFVFPSAQNQPLPSLKYKIHSRAIPQRNKFPTLW